MAAPVVHFEFASTDLPRLREFYSGLFAWEMDDQRMPGYTLVSTGDEGIGGGMMAATGEIPPYFAIYVQVDDVQMYLEKAVRLGGQIAVHPTPIPTGGSFAMLIDPDGNPVGLYRK